MAATKLKNHGTDGSQTTIVALGIGNTVSHTELVYIASEPYHLNVILVPDYTGLKWKSDLDDKVLNVTCLGWCLYYYISLYGHQDSETQYK